MSSAIHIAEKLATGFRERAAAYDRTGEFPALNYDDMREHGYLRAAVPAELGGLGADMAEMARAQQALARGDASTALAVNMHHFQVGAAADAWRAGGPTEALLRRIAAEGIVLASTAAEAIVAGAWTSSTTASRTDGGYVLNGRKFFASQATGMDIVRVNARDAETGDILVFAVPANAPGLRVVETWDTQGMRATASHDIVLEGVELPETAVGARLPAASPIRDPKFAKVVTWFLPLASSVYLGIAEEARALAYDALGTGINTTFRDDALTQAMIGELEAEYLAAESVRDGALSKIASAPNPDEALAWATLAKDIVVERSIATVDKAVAIVGGRAFFRKSPLERLSRDVRAGRFHPPAAPVSYQIAGARLREARERQRSEVSEVVPV